MLQRLAPLALLLASALCIPAQAGLLDKINGAVDDIKRLSSNLPSMGDSTPAKELNPGEGSGGDSTVLPLGLLQYPKSTLDGRVYNPMERVRMPVSVPRRHPDDGWVSPYSVPMEGKVTMVRFSHRTDDSPLLITKHYEAWLAENGFERLMLCEAPCDAADDGSEWEKMVDPSERLSYGLPDNGTYVVGFKKNSMALFGVGRYAGRFVSVVKVVEGTVIDASPWQQVTANRKPPVGVPQSNGSQTAQSDTLNEEVELVASDDLPSRIAESKGFVMVQLTSFDPACPYCTRANPKIDQLAKRYAGKVATWRATWQPWLSMQDDAYIRAQGITGLPATLTFKNGKLVRRLMGDHPLEKMEKELLLGLK
ncbi:thioredoxin family protein [Chitinimonas taiwanensis]|uniref:Thioredoxin domain-containing protein n=1 Tax=Chitinimonas taiwanensis DSM 18899 TaxID=1121279 RepID=A0A1K2H3J8_9NEIS|nr:thioredoxin family protein [Chitinimonas taiwanensis]SFZ70243.1 hypothetical protein SAMN02745887_00121 [Chitinimonas taiwanensis DSM 18899]